MKATINGVRYDSDNATPLAAHTQGKAGDASHWTATLCRQPRGGRFFLTGEGGAMSIFGGKARIIPLDEDEALAWGNRYGGGK